MRIAFTHNVSTDSTEDQAEFDTPATVNELIAALQGLGHEVESMEVSGPVLGIISHLINYHPDLIFNTAEGHRGRFREAFFPALFEELNMPFTGSDSYALTVTLDKHLTKTVLERYGVATPRWQFLEDIAQLHPQELGLPVIIKPNFEGSSKGITQDSIVEHPGLIQAAVQRALRAYPAGVLVEEFIRGRDISVPFLECAAPERHGVLQPVEYNIDPQAARMRRHTIYDYELKGALSHLVEVRAPAKLTTEQALQITTAAQVAVRVLRIRDLGRLDFRLGEDGRLFFLEINALPSLESGSGMYIAARLEGLSEQAVIGAVVNSAARRWGIAKKHTSVRRPRRLTVGFTFNVKRVKPDARGERDEEAEYDAPEVLEAVSEAIAAQDCDVVPLEATADLPARLAASHLDVVFNIAEGIGGRNRESQVPALLEMLGIPYTGSDPVALALSLDKALAKRIVASHSIRTPRFFLMETPKQRLPEELRFPLIVKPVAEGSSKGVLAASIVQDEPSLRSVAATAIVKYRQPALVEEYLPGREFTVALLGYPQARVLPPMEVLFLDRSDPVPVYSFDTKLKPNGKIGYRVPAELSPDKLANLLEIARVSFAALGCRDVARIDFRMDAKGEINFLECNPLPGLTPGWSDLVLIAEAVGISYPLLIGEILSCAVQRRGHSKP